MHAMIRRSWAVGPALLAAAAAAAGAAAAGSAAPEPVLLVDSPGGAVSPGSSAVLRVTVVNRGTAPASSVRVVVHLPAPNRVAKVEPPASLDFFGTGSSFEVPGPLPPGSRASYAVTLETGAEVEPQSVIRGDVELAESGDRVGYTVATGPAIADLTVAADPADVRAVRRAGTLTVAVTDLGPSNSGAPTVLTVMLPRGARLGAAPYGCAADPGDTRLTCGYSESPRRWRQEYISVPFTVSPDVPRKAVLPGGRLTVSNRDDPRHGNDSAGFTLRVDHKATPVARVQDRP